MILESLCNLILDTKIRDAYVEESNFILKNENDTCLKFH